MKCGIIDSRMFLQIDPIPFFHILLYIHRRLSFYPFGLPKNICASNLFSSLISSKSTQTSFIICFFSFFSSFSLSSPSFPNFFKFHLCIQNHFTKISSQRIALSRSLQQEITTIATSALSRYVVESSAKSVHFSAFTICQVWAPIAGSTLTLSCHSFATWDWTVSRNDLASWVDYVITLIAIEAGESVEVKVLAKRIDLLTMIRMQVVALIAWSTSIIGPNKTSRFIDGLTSTGVSYHEARITLQTFITCDIVVPT